MDSSTEYPAMSVCPKWQKCSAPCCPLDPNLHYTEVHGDWISGRHWYVGWDEVCSRIDMGKHPMVRAQRRIVKNTKPVHVDYEFSVAELMERGRKKRSMAVTPQALAALAAYREKKRSEKGFNDQTPTQVPDP